MLLRHTKSMEVSEKSGFLYEGYRISGFRVSGLPVLPLRTRKPPHRLACLLLVSLRLTGMARLRIEGVLGLRV